MDYIRKCDVYIVLFRHTARASNAHSQESAVHEGTTQPCTLSWQHFGYCLASGAHHFTGTLVPI
jgi:hypothetical protein